MSQGVGLCLGRQFKHLQGAATASSFLFTEHLSILICCFDAVPHLPDNPLAQSLDVLETSFLRLEMQI